jgi:TRAP-type C4-dicarboxylate transport system permease large subunit
VLRTKAAADYTPPPGLNLFISQAIFDAPLGRNLARCPFLLVNFVALLIIAYVPAISMVLFRATRDRDSLLPCYQR